MVLEFDQGNYLVGQDSETESQKLSPYQRRIVSFCEEYLSGRSKFPLPSSGSTGKAKTITLTRSQMQASAQATIKTLGLKPGDRFLVCLNTDYIGGKMMLVRGMELGAKIRVTAPRSDLRHCEPVDFVALVPLQVYRLLESRKGRDFIKHCAKIIVGGAPLNSRSIRALSRFKNEIYQTFGMTETVSHFALKQLTVDPWKMFRALPGVALSKDPRGCLVVKGPMTDFREVATNDLVEIVDSHSFKWLGRYDDVINSGGYLVNPQKINHWVEQELEDMGHPTEFVICGIPHDELGQMVTLVLEGTPLLPTQEERLINKLRQCLHSYEVPKKIQYLSQFPRTETEKPQTELIKGLVTRG